MRRCPTPAKLDGDKVLKRQVKVYGIEHPVIFTFSAQGLKAQIAGTKVSVDQAWPQVIAAMNTPGNSPSFLAGRAYDLLKHKAAERRKKLQDVVE